MYKRQATDRRGWPRPGPIVTWHKWVATKVANYVVALKAGTGAVELSAKCLYGGVQGKTSRESRLVLSSNGFYTASAVLDPRD